MADYFSARAKKERAEARKRGEPVGTRNREMAQVQRVSEQLAQRDVFKPVDKSVAKEDNRRFVTFVPRTVAEGIANPALAIISIRGRHDSHAQLHNDVAKLYLSFGTTGDEFNKTFDREDYNAIVEFILAHPDKHFVVHCGEGRMRSSAIAMGIENMQEVDLKLRKDFPGCIGSTASMDRGLYRSFVGFNYEKDFEASK